MYFLISLSLADVEDEGAVQKARRKLVLGFGLKEEEEVWVVMDWSDEVELVVLLYSSKVLVDLLSFSTRNIFPDSFSLFRFLAEWFCF